jgi:cytochrome bd-type quinol oxidase subunit 1
LSLLLCLNTLEHQPTNIAAIEAHWDGSSPGELVLFAWPDESAETNKSGGGHHSACSAAVAPIACSKAYM